MTYGQKNWVRYVHTLFKQRGMLFMARETCPFRLMTESAAAHVVLLLSKLYPQCLLELERTILDPGSVRLNRYSEYLSDPP